VAQVLNSNFLILSSNSTYTERRTPLSAAIKIIAAYLEIAVTAENGNLNL